MVPDQIIAAAKGAFTPTVEEWLDAGGDVNAPDETGTTLLLESVRHSRVELCRVLLARGADPSLGNDYRTLDVYRGEIPLWLAAYEASGGLYHIYYSSTYEHSPLHAAGRGSRARHVGGCVATARPARTTPSSSSSSSETTASSGTSSRSGKKRTKNTYT